MKEINIDGEIYVKKSAVPVMAVDGDMPYVIIRTYSAGVHAGYLKERNGKEVTLLNARRLWQWAGAFTLNEIATRGVSEPDECKFSCVTPEILLTEAIEVITCTTKAMSIIKGVKNYEY